MNSKILLIRFSSFGDVTQCLSVPSLLKEKIPEAEIHWVTRADMAPLLKDHPAITKIWQFDRKLGANGLIDLGKKLREEKFTHIYDAHNNLRSRILCWIMRFPFVFNRPQLLRRSIRRWKRFLLFKFRLNYFEMPFSGQRDLLEPLKKWGIDFHLPPVPQIHVTATEIEKVRKLVPSQFIALAPSAAFELKRWPVEHWKQLISLFPNEKFVLLGGPQDHFISEIAAVAPDRALNLAGKTDLRESAAVVALANALVSNDTGVLHVGEQLGKPTVALMGPAPFGFPSRPSTKIMQLDLTCRPCSKHGQGPCINPKFHECLRGISPEKVKEALKEMETR
jgi:lipopolysaccharide heptosyltransferase II